VPPCQESWPRAPLGAEDGHHGLFATLWSAAARESEGLRHHRRSLPRNSDRGTTPSSLRSGLRRRGRARDGRRRLGQHRDEFDDDDHNFLHGDAVVLLSPMPSMVRPDLSCLLCAPLSILLTTHHLLSTTYRIWLAKDVDVFYSTCLLHQFCCV
jgi:hypothetical protein